VETRWVGAAAGAVIGYFLAWLDTPNSPDLLVACVGCAVGAIFGPAVAVRVKAERSSVGTAFIIAGAGLIMAKLPETISYTLKVSRSEFDSSLAEEPLHRSTALIAVALMAIVGGWFLRQSGMSIRKERVAAEASDTAALSDAVGLHTGTLARLLFDKGFGFIRDETGIEHFFHRSSVRQAVFDLLREGQRVTFTSEESPHGPRANNIHLIEN
jgi:CspA family cold shock protein